jgi:hypothetical protein
MRTSFLFHKKIDRQNCFPTVGSGGTVKPGHIGCPGFQYGETLGL